MKKEIKILFAEDIISDLELAKLTIENAGINFIFKLIETEKDFIYNLENFNPDIIISDYKMPLFDGMKALIITQNIAPLTPFILLTGSINEEIAVEIMKAGAWDYVLKENLNKLPIAINEVLNLKKLRQEKIQRQKDLEQNEEKFRNFFNSNLAGNFISTRKGELIDCNPAYIKILNFKNKEEILLTNTNSCYQNPQDREDIIEIINREKKIENIELNLKRKDGEKFTAIANISAEFENNKLKILKGFILDITQNKKAEKEITKLNRTYAVLSEINETIVRVKNKKVLFDEACRIASEIGKFDLTWIGIRDKDLNTTRAVSFAGISKENLDLLNIEDEISKNIVTELFSGTHFIENDLLKYSSPQIWTKNAIELGYKSCAFFPIKIFEENIGTINFYSKEAFFFDQKEINLLNNLAKDISYALGFIENDKKRKSAEKALVFQNQEYKTLNEELKLTNENLFLAKQKAEESDRLKSSFLANMSHEIRTPMNGILGFTQLLMENNLEQEQKTQFLEIIDKSGKRLLNTINDLINISKIEVGQEKVKLSETDVNVILEEIETFFNPELISKSLILQIHKPPSTENQIILTDSVKLHAIFVNLIKNAIKYSKKGNIDIGYNLKDDEIEFFIRDSGIGISKDFQTKLFKRFVQEEQGYTRVYEGSGLGLSIVKAYIDLLEGKIWLEYSEINKGSEFRFTLPLKKEYIKKQHKIPEINKDENKIENKFNILIAEDDNFSFKYISLIAKDISKQIYRAKNGLEIFDIIETNPDIQIILMDIQMPKMDGYTAAKKLKEKNPEIYIIAQTAFNITDEFDKYKNGFDDFILKPIKKEELIKKIMKRTLQNKA